MVTEIGKSTGRVGRGRPRWPYVAGAGGVIAAVVAGGLWLSNQDRKESGDSTLDTDTPTPTVTPTETQISVVTAAGNEESGLMATIQSLQVTMASLLPRQTSTALPSSTPDLVGQAIWTGQGRFNSLRSDNNANEVEAFKDYLTILSSKTSTDRIDSAYTALANQFKGEEFDALSDPLDETGMELSGAEIGDIRDNGNVLGILSNNPKVSELMRGMSSDPNKVYMGVWGRGHDRDAITAVLAAALNYEYYNTIRSGSMDSEQTLLNTVVFGDQSLSTVISQWQGLIVEKTREADLGISSAEQARRDRNDMNDASARMNPALRLDDQIEVCEEVREQSTDGTRNGQPQILIRVNHINGGQDNLGEANVAEEVLGFVLVFDKETKKWDVVALTSRGFSGDPLNNGDTANAVSGDELEPCGEVVAVPEESPTPTVTSTTPFIPSSTATQPPFNPTRPPEQPTNPPKQTAVPTNPAVIPTVTPGEPEGGGGGGGKDRPTQIP